MCLCSGEEQIPNWLVGLLGAEANHSIHSATGCWEETSTALVSGWLFVMGSVHLHCFLPQPLFILCRDYMSQALLLPINGEQATASFMAAGRSAAPDPIVLPVERFSSPQQWCWASQSSGWKSPLGSQGILGNAC